MATDPGRSRKKSDDEESESDAADWSLYFWQNTEKKVLAQQPFGSLLYDLQFKATPQSQESLASYSYLTPAATSKKRPKLVAFLCAMNPKFFAIGNNLT